MFAYCRNNPVMHSDPNGDWVVDAVFLAVDIANFKSNPSLKNAGWVALSALCFVDASGIASSSIHIARTLKTAEQAVRAVDESKNIVRAIHNNSLNTKKLTDVYVIREQGSGKILRFGETTQGYVKRGQQWARVFKKNGIDTYVQPLKTGLSKREARSWETRYIKTYEKAFGRKPPYNKNYH
jgi:hypothetical protein